MKDKFYNSDFKGNDACLNGRGLAFIKKWCVNMTKRINSINVTINFYVIVVYVVHVCSHSRSNLGIANPGCLAPQTSLFYSNKY